MLDVRTESDLWCQVICGLLHEALVKYLGHVMWCCNGQLRSRLMLTRGLGRFLVFFPYILFNDSTGFVCFTFCSLTFKTDISKNGSGGTIA